jgi:NAD(P)-dependent dehydrogenase (short-subunit alcohol dehydrogenase family)
VNIPRMGLLRVIRRIFAPRFEEPGAQPSPSDARQMDASEDGVVRVANTLSPDSQVALSTPLSRGKRDPHCVLVVGADTSVGKEVAAALKASNEEYVVVGVVRTPDYPLPSCDRTVVLDVVAEIAVLGEKARELGVGVVIWCELSGNDRKPMDVDYAAVRDLAENLASDWLVDTEDCVGIFDFSNARDCAAFREIDDVIMGGISRSQLRPGGSSSPAVWTGNVSLANGGGFSSLRAPLPFSNVGQGRGIDLSSCQGIAVTCRGDGRRYKINLKNDESPEFVFQTSFDTIPDSSEWQTIRVPFSDFVPVKRGKLQFADRDPNGAIYETALDTSTVTSVGLVYSKIEPGGMPCPLFSPGPFELEVTRIDAYRAVSPRFVLVSSAAVTRPFWKADKLRLYGSAARIPIVELNPKIGNLLGAKLAGENALRGTKTPYTIVRPVGVSNSVPAGFEVRLSQGDVVTGQISPMDVARCVVSTLGTDAADAATWKTFEISGTRNVIDDSDFSKAIVASVSRFPSDKEQIVYPEVLSNS